MKTIRQLINLMESRNPELEYEELADRVIAKLYSYNSQSYTKLAQKIERIDQLEAEIKALKAEVKQGTRESIAELFDAEDAAKTRVVETLSFIFTLSKDPEPTKAPKYKDILDVLSKQLTPELIIVLEGLKDTMVTKTQKEPSLRLKPQQIDEGVFSKLKQTVMSWASRYDSKLAKLKQMASSYN